MTQATNRVKVKLDAVGVLRSKAGASLQIGGVQRAADVDDQGNVYFRESIVPAEVRCNLVHVRTSDLEALRDFTGGQVTYEADAGKTYTIGNAFTVSLGELANGEIEVTFGGDPAVES